MELLIGSFCSGDLYTIEARWQSLSRKTGKGFREKPGKSKWLAIDLKKTTTLYEDAIADKCGLVEYLLL
jgi:hypothetical protein